MPFDWSKHEGRPTEDYSNRPLIKGDEKTALIEAGTVIELEGMRLGIMTQYGERAFLDVKVQGEPMVLAFGYGDKGFARRDDLLDDLKAHIDETGETLKVKIVKWGDQAQGLEPA